VQSVKVESVNSAINVTPLVDVVLVLLIIFMVVTPMLQKGPPVVLPRTSDPPRTRARS
jgi:biopolymer transport protein TolR